MVHIRDDRRAEQSAERLYTALMVCLQEKPFADITITELVERAGVSRSTFYRNFDAVADLLWWKADCCFGAFFGSYLEREDKTAYGMMEYGMAYWQAHWQLLEQIFAIGRMDIIFDGFQKNILQIRDMLPEHSGISDSEMDYFSAVHAGIFASMCKIWIENGRREDSACMADIVSKSVAPFVNIRPQNEEESKAL